MIGDEKTISRPYLSASRQDRLQLLGGLVEGCHTTVGRGRFRLHRAKWAECLLEDIRALALSLGLDFTFQQVERDGDFDPANAIKFDELDADITAVPCLPGRLARSHPAHLTLVFSDPVCGLCVAVADADQGCGTLQ